MLVHVNRGLQLWGVRLLVNIEGNNGPDRAWIIGVYIAACYIAECELVIGTFCDDQPQFLQMFSSSEPA